MTPTYPVILYLNSQVAIKPRIRFGTKSKMKGHSELVAYAKMDRSIWRKKLRKEMLAQLYDYFIK